MAKARSVPTNQEVGAYVAAGLAFGKRLAVTEWPEEWQV